MAKEVFVCFFYDAKLNKIVNLSFSKSRETGGLSGVSWKLGLNLRRASLSIESKGTGKKLSQNSMKGLPGRIISKMRFYLNVLFMLYKTPFLLHFSREEQSSFTACVSAALIGFSLYKQMRDGASCTHFTVAELPV